MTDVVRTDRRGQFIEMRRIDLPGGYAVMWVVAQSARLRRLLPRPFRASNGVEIGSGTHPQFDRLIDRLYVRGADESEDLRPILVPEIDANRVCEAVREFNAQRGATPDGHTFRALVVR